MKDQFEYVDSSDYVTDYHLSDAPLTGKLYFRNGDVVVKKEQIEAFSKMMGEGVIIAGDLTVEGALLLDDTNVLCAKRVTCESASFNECFCDISHLEATDYIYVDSCASHGYSVDVWTGKTNVLIVDSWAVKHGPASVNRPSEWERTYSIDSSDYDIDSELHVDFGAVLYKDAKGLIAAVEAGSLVEFLQAYAE